VQRQRFTWAKLNAYGILLAALALMGVTDLIHPGKANLARLVGEVPPGQVFWVTGFIISGILLMFGFARTDRIAETIGLVVLLVSLVIQTAVAYALLGLSDFTLTRFVIVGIVALCMWARCSVLWSKGGLSITIPPRGDHD
jgi:hypothetical protein